MGIFQRSLAEDSVDRYTHTWAVLLLLLLSLVTWLLPLSPALQVLHHPGPQDGSASSAGTMASGSPALTEFPKFKAACWCPAQFTDFHVRYTHKVCESAFNYAMRGGNTSDTAAQLHYIREDAVPVKPEDSELFTPDVLPRPEKKNMKEKGKRMPKNDIHIIQSKTFLQITTPFYLFLFAVCLKIPHLVRTLLSSLVTNINVDKVLDSANRGSGLDHQSRHQLHGELAKGAAEKVRHSPYASSILYLLMKVFMCVAVIAEVSVVHKTLLPQSRDLVRDFQTAAAKESSSAYDDSHLSYTNADKNSDDGMQNNNTLTTYPDLLLFCVFRIRQVSNEHVYETQCLFSQVVPTPSSSSSQSSESLRYGESANQKRMFAHEELGLYETLYKILLTCLITLAVLNVASLLIWIVLLFCRPCRKPQESYLPLDGYFLLLMATRNAGLEVVTGLFQGGAWSAEEGHENIQLKE